MTTNQEIGERVHLLLRRQSTPQEKLAEHLHISQAAISKKVRGNRPFSVDELLAVAGFFDVPLSEVLPTGTKIACVPSPSPSTRPIRARKPGNRAALAAA